MVKNYKPLVVQKPLLDAKLVKIIGKLISCSSLNFLCIGYVSDLVELFLFAKQWPNRSS